MRILKQKQISEQEANSLIEKYYEGNTTVEEERKLALFLCQKDLPEQFVAERAMFAYFADEKQVEKTAKIIRFNPIIKWATSIAAVSIFAVILIITTSNKTNGYAYVDGVKITNKKEILHLAQRSFENLTNNSNIIEEDLGFVTQEDLIEEQLQLFFIEK